MRVSYVFKILKDPGMLLRYARRYAFSIAARIEFNVSNLMKLDRRCHKAESSAIIYPVTF